MGIQNNTYVFSQENLAKNLQIRFNALVSRLQIFVKVLFVIFKKNNADEINFYDHREIHYREFSSSPIFNVLLIKTLVKSFRQRR